MFWSLPRHWVAKDARFVWFMASAAEVNSQFWTGKATPGGVLPAPARARIGLPHQHSPPFGRSTKALPLRELRVRPHSEKVGPSVWHTSRGSRGDKGRGEVLSKSLRRGWYHPAPQNRDRARCLQSHSPAGALCRVVSEWLVRSAKLRCLPGWASRLLTSELSPRDPALAPSLDCLPHQSRSRS